jgi:1-acyl-sn-glycerol-3-phosphate acyltransferase
MVDIEPMLTYNYSNFGIKNIITIFFVIYIGFIYPISLILNYDIKHEKEIIQKIVLECINWAECSFHKVSKQDLILEKDIIYMTNHTSVGDFFIDPYITHYSSRFIALNKMRMMLPIMGFICVYTSFATYISNNNNKETVVENFKYIEEIRKNDKTHNIILYPEGMRRPHRPTPSAILKKGFIYHSFEHNLPIQIIHTTNKDYVVDDENFLLHKKTNLFTYYGPKIDPQKLRHKFEKKNKRPYTKDDYYADIYKKWTKIWSKMDKYRIDTLRNQGLSHEECLEKMKHYSTKFPKIEDKILRGDRPLNSRFLLVRCILWTIVYYIIYKIVERFFSFFSSFYKKIGACSSSSSSSSCSSFSLLFLRFPFLQNFLSSPTSPTPYTPLLSKDAESPDAS